MTLEPGPGHEHMITRVHANQPTLEGHGVGLELLQEGSDGLLRALGVAAVKPHLGQISCKVTKAR